MVSCRTFSRLTIFQLYFTKFNFANMSKNRRKKKNIYINAEICFAKVLTGGRNFRKFRKVLSLRYEKFGLRYATIYNKVSIIGSFPFSCSREAFINLLLWRFVCICTFKKVWSYVIRKYRNDLAAIDLRKFVLRMLLNKCLYFAF